LKKWYRLLDPKNRENWIKNSDNQWDKHDSETYKVLKALYSGEWECRVCGPVPKVNAQPAARLRDLKKRGYFIGSKSKHCSDCGKQTTHDLLIMLPMLASRFEDGNELRLPISEKLKTRVKKVLGMKEVCFNVKRTSVELLVDHKFPSQRWTQKESKNIDSMSDEEIKNKFQLLNNQSNMLKSRYCDRCVKEGKRGDFMGIKWYYQGNENWVHEFDNEEGCFGCPWYDLEKWKIELQNSLE
jgi:hypothetical protein